MNKLFLLFFLSLISLTGAQTQWELKKDANDIKIFTRSLPGKKFDEYKATTIINTPIKNVFQKLITAPQYTKEHNSGVSYYVKSPKKNQHIYYAYKDLPWPVKDRDVVTLLTVKKINDSKYKLILESAPDAIPQKTNTLRVKKLIGFWLLEEQNETTKVTQQLFVNPEGSLPAFIVNSLLIKGPFNTFKALRTSIKKPYDEVVLGR